MPRRRPKGIQLASEACTWPASLLYTDALMTQRPRPAVTSQLRRSLIACTRDGVAYAVMVGLGETYFAAFALWLGASPTQVGLLTTLPILVGSALQLGTPFAASHVGNRRWVIVSATAQALTFIPIAALAYGQRAPFWPLLAWLCVYWSLALGVNAPWNTWMGKMIPPELRGRYFGRRNVYIQAALLAALLTGGGFLHLTERSTLGPAVGFVGLFLAAMIARFVSTYFLTRQHEPAAVDAPPSTNVATILRGFFGEAHGRITRLIVLIYGAVHLSAAYFAPFMLNELKLSYAEFTLLNATVLVARVLSSAYWGDVARSFGNRRTLQVAATLLIPLSSLWVVSHNLLYLVTLQLYAGFAWSGFELLAILSFFDCTTEANRARVLALYSLLNGIAMVTSSVIGGVILRTLGPSGYPVIFIGSTMLRAAAVIFFSGKVGRKRAEEHSFASVLARVVTFRTAEGPQWIDPLLALGRRRPNRRRSSRSGDS